MNKVLFWNILMNLSAASLFVTLNVWALQNNFEETFVALAILFGLSTILLNALFVSKVKKESRVK